MAASPKAKAAAGGALALALGLFAILEGYGPSAGPGTYKSYVDIAGVVTICNGHTGADVKLGQTFTKPQCDEIAKQDLGKAFAVEDKYIRAPEELDPWVRAAAALFITNVGEGAFAGSSFLRLLNERKITEACNSLLLWTKARAGPQGALVVVRGLINRRQAERSLCLGEGWSVEKS
jgi:lysozyme